MGYTNETTHYGIPLPLGSDKTTPMDYNTSAQKVDTDLFEAKTDSASALQKANQLQHDLATTNNNVTGVKGRVTTLEGTVTTQGQSILQNTQDIGDVRADALDMIVAKDEGTAQVATVAVAKGEYFRYNDVLYIATANISVGDTIVPNTNCKATNVATELVSSVNAINEINADLQKVSANIITYANNVTAGGSSIKIADLHSVAQNFTFGESAYTGGTDLVIGTIANADKPSAEAFAPCVTTAGVNGYVKINTSGEVHFWASVNVPANTYYFFNLVW